jgi:hypothetical protein
MTVLAREQATDDGLYQLRQRIAAAVIARLRPDIPGISSHFGERCVGTDEPEVLVYRHTGGQFRFLAFAFSPWRMWDLHVGIVPQGDRHLSAGFHISERAAPILMPALRGVALTIGVTVQHQPAAVEYQANLPVLAIDEVPVEDIVYKTSDLCRQVARVGALTVSPEAMRKSGN